MPVLLRPAVLGGNDTLKVIAVHSFLRRSALAQHPADHLFDDRRAFVALGFGGLPRVA